MSKERERHFSCENYRVKLELFRCVVLMGLGALSALVRWRRQWKIHFSSALVFNLFSREVIHFRENTTPSFEPLLAVIKRQNDGELCDIVMSWDYLSCENIAKCWMNLSTFSLLFWCWSTPHERYWMKCHIKNDSENFGKAREPQRQQTVKREHVLSMLKDFKLNFDSPPFHAKTQNRFAALLILRSMASSNQE